MNSDGPFSVLAVGLLSGWIAQRIVDRRISLWACLWLGLIGAVCGRAIALALDLELPGPLGVLALSTTGSILILALFVLVGRRR